MKHFFAILLLFPVFISAQPRTSIDIFGAAGYAEVHNSFLRDLDFDEPERFIDAYRFGVGVSHSVGSNLSIRAGFQAAQYGTRFAAELFDINGAPQDVAITFDTHYYYLENMVALRYHINTFDRWSPFVEIGGNVGFFVKGTFKTKFNPEPDPLPFDDRDFDDDNVRKTSLVGRVGIGTDYGLNERLSLYGMMAFQHHLAKQNVNVETRILPWQGTLELGVRLFVGG